MNKYKNKILFWLGVILLFSISLLVFSNIYEGVLPKLVEEINNSSIGAILTAIVTVFLLTQQSENEEIKEKNSKVFEKKLAIYDNFINGIQNIFEDKEIDELEQQRLIFQLAILKMHSSGENIEKISSELRKIIELPNMDKDGNKLPIDQNLLASHLFEIVGIFQEELYGNRKGKTDLTVLNHNVTDIVNTAKEKWSKIVFIGWDDYTKYLQDIKGTKREIINLIKFIIFEVEKSINKDDYYLKYSPTHVSFYIKGASSKRKIFLWLTPLQNNLIIGFNNKDIKLQVPENSYSVKSGPDGINYNITKEEEYTDEIKTLVKEFYLKTKQFNSL